MMNITSDDIVCQTRFVVANTFSQCRGFFGCFSLMSLLQRNLWPSRQQTPRRRCWPSENRSASLVVTRLAGFRASRSNNDGETVMSAVLLLASSDDENIKCGSTHAKRELGARLEQAVGCPVLFESGEGESRQGHKAVSQSVIAPPSGCSFLISGRSSGLVCLVSFH